MESNANVSLSELTPLTFPSINFGSRETPWDLRVLLWKGGAAARSTLALRIIEEGQLGRPCIERVPLVKAIHNELNGRAISGRSKYFLQSTIKTIRDLFAWSDIHHPNISLENIERAYIGWTDHLINRSRVKRDLKEQSAYGIASAAASVLDEVLERPTSLIRTTRLNWLRKSTHALSAASEKQNLSLSFEFGRAIQDICDALTVENVLHNNIPVHIPLRTGGVITYWGRFNEATKRGFLDRYQNDRTLATRYPLANIRIEAELFMFLAQTGMNITQAHRLKLRNFRYSSHLDGYQVMEMKARRGGTVLFEIFKDFKPHFERYLAWRRELFPKSDRLFPFYDPYYVAVDSKFQSRRIREICANHGIPFCPPRTIRNTRVNWLLRQSADPALTAEMAQHTKQTLLNVYERPSLQRALVEVMRFWSKNDPSLAHTSVGPGACDGTPAAAPNMPKNAPTPDCVRPSGCFWCEHHRDVDTQDYVWSLASFGHLKRIELLKRRNTSLEEAPAQLVIDRIDEKLGWLHSSNQQRKAWVVEANALVDEGEYHPDWCLMINQLEGRT